MHKTLVALSVLVLGVLSCGQAKPRQLSLYPTEVTSTPLVVQITTTPNATQTPKVVVVSTTPQALGTLCVHASLAVNLRPSPNDQAYPIMTLSNGTELVDLGGRSGKWMFVALGDKKGWVNGDFVGKC